MITLDKRLYPLFVLSSFSASAVVTLFQLFLRWYDSLLYLNSMKIHLLHRVWNTFTVGISRSMVISLLLTVWWIAAGF